MSESNNTRKPAKITRIPTKGMSREDWLQARNQSIGGSDAAAILGLNDYSSPYMVWLEKTGKRPGFEGNLITETGNYLEAFVADLFTRETGKKVRRVNAIIKNSDYPFAHANIDREVVAENALLEIKTTNSWANVRLVNSGEYPQAWYAQVSHYLMTGGYDRGYLAVLLNNRDFQIFTIERDEAEIAALAEQERHFWDMVQNNIPPSPNGSKGDAEAIGEMIGPGDEEMPPVDLFDRKGLIMEYLSVRESVKALDQRLEAIKQELQLSLGKSEMGFCDEYKVTWKTVNSNRFDVKRFKAARPEIDLAPYYSESVSRRFEIR